MIYSIWHGFITAYEEYTGTGVILVLFVLAMGYLIIFTSDKKKRDKNAMLILSPLGSISCALSDVIEKAGELHANNKYIAYAQRILVLLLCAFVILISGKRIISPDVYVKADNTMHMPNELIETMNTILEDTDDEQIGIATMPGYGEYYTAYSSRFFLMYEDPSYGELTGYDAKVSDAYRELGKKNPDMRKLALAAKDSGCNYIVIDNDACWPEEPLTNFGYELIANCGNKDIYKIVGEGNGL